MPSTISLRNVVDFTRTRTRMIQLVNVGGIPNQPALDLCNDVLQTLLSSPNNWKFNKGIIPPFTTIPNQQDYWISGCTASVFAGQPVPPPFFHKAIVYLNSALDDPPGLEPKDDYVIAHHGIFSPDGIQGKGTSQIPPRFREGDRAVIMGAGNNAYNGEHIILEAGLRWFSFAMDTTNLQPDGGQGINGLNWVEHATLEDFNSTAFVRPKRDIEVVSSIPQESVIGQPFKVCNQFEEIQQCGHLVISKLMIRFFQLPSSMINRTFLFYQFRPLQKTSLDDNWAPWPDELAYVLRSGLYAKALDHGEDPRANIADAKWQQDIARALGLKQQELRHESYFPDLPILRGG